MQDGALAQDGVPLMIAAAAEYCWHRTSLAIRRVAAKPADSHHAIVTRSIIYPLPIIFHVVETTAQCKTSYVPFGPSTQTRPYCITRRNGGEPDSREPFILFYTKARSHLNKASGALVVSAEFQPRHTYGVILIKTTRCKVEYQESMGWQRYEISSHLSYTRRQKTKTIGRDVEDRRRVRSCAGFINPNILGTSGVGQHRDQKYEKELLHSVRFFGSSVIIHNIRRLVKK